MQRTVTNGSTATPSKVIPKIGSFEAINPSREANGTQEPATEQIVEDAPPVKPDELLAGG